MDHWICPNDRQLSLRARLGTGWSVHSIDTTSLHKEQSMTVEELDKIIEVIKEAEQMEKIEMDRIGYLIERLDFMKKNARGDGIKACVLCGERFSVFHLNSLICADCSKSVCHKCGFKTYCKNKMKWRCKLCYEYRELWSKSGAWFYRSIPKIAIPHRSDVLAKKFNSSSIPNTLAPLKSIVRPTGTVKSLDAWSKNCHYQSKSKIGVGSTDSSQSDNEDDDTRIIHKIKPFHDSASDNADSPLSQSSICSQKSGDLWSTSDKSKYDASSLTSGITSAISNPLPLDSSRELTAKPQSVSSRIHNQVPCLELCMTLQSPSLDNDSHHDSIPDTPSMHGVLEFSLYYDSKEKNLKCVIHRAKGLPPMGNNSISDPYVKMHLIPGSSKSTKRRTKTIKKSSNPEWNESFNYNGITDTDRKESSVRLAVFDENRIGQTFIGETRIALKNLHNDRLKEFSILLSGLQVDKESKESHALNDRGRILVGLRYCLANEKLVVSIKECSNLAVMDSNGFSDPYVKLYLKPDKNKTTKNKTKVKTKTLNPQFNEEFFYQIKLCELTRRTLELTVWDRDIGCKSDYIGGIQFGPNGTSEQLRHWLDTLKNPDKYFEHWHRLTNRLFND